MKLYFKKSNIFQMMARLSALLEGLKDTKEYVLEIKEHRKHRSLSANSYYWVLLEKISQVLGSTKEEIHEQMLQDYGTLDTTEEGEIMDFSSRYLINPLEAGVHCKYRGSSQLNGVTWYHYYLIKGSSRYDSREFSVLVNGAVQEAKDLDIETLTPEELARLRYE